MDLKEILKYLSVSDELPNLEAKTASEAGKSIMETICAFSNEPGLGGGYIALGIKKDNETLFPEYILEGVSNPDKLQSDIATQCSTIFNIPIRPEFKVETHNGKTAIIVHIKELGKHQKPLFFKAKGLPAGAYRRIGTTDHKCTEDDLRIFFSDQQPYDQCPVDYTSIDDIDEAALKRYRSLREKINPLAEELTYDDKELLLALGGMTPDGTERLTIAGILVFGKSATLRRVFPMMRVDYIRVPGNEWVRDPDERFSTIDMRGALILLVYRLVDAIYADLPKGFKLEENHLQADSIGLPVKVMREAIINALMHRSYRVNSPIQIIRYDNRIEIINPGFSLKSDERLGEPGSETRNAFIAAIFHETNLAETKGSGIRAMRRLLEKAKLAPPTFESDRENDRFTVRLLLHHFLSEADLEWLSGFDGLQLSDSQKQALIFVRELGVIDNTMYRQLSDVDTLKASGDLRALRDKGLIVQKGKGKSTYYLASDSLRSTSLFEGAIEEEEDLLVAEDNRTATEDGPTITQDDTLATEDNKITTEDRAERKEKLLSELGSGLAQEITHLNKRVNDKSRLRELILQICSVRYFKISELAILLEKSENYLGRHFITPLIREGKLVYLFPEEITHKGQAYKTL